MEQLKCPNCGGNVDRSRMVCPYCGTQFKKDFDPCGVSIYVNRFDPQIEILKGRVILPEEVLHINETDAVGLYEHAVKCLAEQMAKGLTPLMEIRQSYDPARMERHVTGIVRALRPDYRF